MSEHIDRAIKLMRIAAEVIRNDASHSKAFYDGDVCDGYCIAEDLDIMAELLSTPNQAEAGKP